MNVDGKIIVVTGAGSGMGRELTLELVKRGARVAATDIHTKALEETQQLVAADQRDNVSLHTFNVADQAAVDALPQEVIDMHGAVDGVINNAGIIQPFVRVNDLDFESIERVMNVNFYGTLYMVKAFLPHLLERQEAHMMNISSMGGFLPVPGQSVYGASKAAVKLLTEGLWAECQGTSVDVTVVFPGAVATNIAENSEVATPDVGSDVEQKFTALPAAEAARQMLDAMEKGKARVFVGKDSQLLNKLYRLSPGFATKMITKQMQSLLK